MPFPRQLRPVKPKRLETDIVREGVRYLALLKIPCWRVNVGMIPNGRGGFRRSLMTGMSDVIAIVEGIFLALEAKTETGKMTDAQREFQAEVERGGGVYMIFRKTEDIQRAIEKARAVARTR